MISLVLTEESSVSTSGKLPLSMSSSTFFHIVEYVENGIYVASRDKSNRTHAQR